MSNTPYFDAYEMYRASINNLKLIKTYTTLPSGDKVLSDVSFSKTFDTLTKHI